MQADFIAFYRRAFLRHGPRRFAVMQPESADRKYDDHPGELTDAQLAAHLEGRAAYAVPTAENGLASLLPFDIDAGGESAARALMEAAAARGLFAFGQHDPQRGRGYVWIPFDELTNAERIRRLGDELLAQVQPQAKGWKIENRATAEDTRLPFARHRWTGRRGALLTQGGSAELDGPDFSAVLDIFRATYRENPTGSLPPAPESVTTPSRRSAERISGPGVTIATYNTSTDLVSLLESYGARRAKGQGARLYFCPLHGDDHASLLVHKDGERCMCLSQGSDCPLSGHQYDAFNVFCAAERLSTRQALRRLNGLPDDPEPGRGPQTSPSNRGPRTPPQTPQEGPREARSGKTAYHSTPTPSKDVLRPQEGRTEATEGRRTPADCPGLPKSARRLLDVIAAHPGGYIRGKYTLARLLDVDPRTVQRSLRRLEAEGLIIRHERGRDGQTDIYQLATQRPARAAQDGDQGRHLPPTVELEILSTPEALEAERGGNPPATGDDQAAHPSGAGLVLPTREGGATHGPGGAISYPGGAAYVPPEAADWYATQQAATHCATALVQRDATPQEPEPQQAELPVQEPPVASYDTNQPPRKRRRSRTRYVDPGRLHGRIIAAERKAEKLERTGRDADRRQARAIRRQAETLKRQLEAMREAPPPGDPDEPDAEDWTPTPPPPPAPPSSSLPGVDWRYLETLARAGEMHGIETHCRLYREDFAQVRAELARRGHLAARGAP